MVSQDYLLDDQAMRDFVVNGYATVLTDLPADFHASIARQAEPLGVDGLGKDKILACIPDLFEVFNRPAVRGVLASVLGHSYVMYRHRHCHASSPSDPNDLRFPAKKHFHQDGASGHHRLRTVFAFYYPQDVTADMGPTAIIPRSQYYSTAEASYACPGLPLTCRAGTVTIAHLDTWHGGTVNYSTRRRFLMKFLFQRMDEPQEPSWRSENPDWRPAENGTGGANLEVLWEHLWHWHCGRQSIGAREPATGNISALIDGLQDEDEVVRLQSAYGLAQFGQAAVPALIDALLNEAPRRPRLTELYCRYALVAVGRPAAEALTEQLGHADEWVRASAAKILGDMGQGTQSTVYALMERLEDESSQVRANAAEALGLIGQGAASAVGALTRRLADEPDQVRIGAAEALAKIGPAAVDAVAELTDCLADEQPYVRNYASQALERIDNSETKRALSDYFAAYPTEAYSRAWTKHDVAAAVHEG